MRFFILSLSLLNSLYANFNMLSRAALTDLKVNKCIPIPSTNNCLSSCSENVLVHVHNVTLTPYPPSANQDLEISAFALLDEDVVAGASLEIVVKVVVFEIFKHTFDLCDELPRFGLHCPVKKGLVELNSKVQMPAILPMGTFTVLANAKTRDKRLLSDLRIDAKLTK